MDIDIDCLNRIQNGTKLRKFESALSFLKFFTTRQNSSKQNAQFKDRIDNHYTIVARVYTS